MNLYQFADLRIGVADEFVVCITEQMLTDFLNISGDSNPLHTDKQHAQSMGYKDRVVYGLLTSSFYSQLVGVYLPGKHALLHGIDITFKHPVFIGDVLKIRGEISYINETFRQVEIKAAITNQDGQQLSKAKIKVGLSE